MMGGTLNLRCAKGKWKVRVIIALMLLSNVGCASLVTGHNQTLSVETTFKGERVSGATCKLVNNKGTWFVTTPGSVTVHRSFDALRVFCEKEGFEPSDNTAKSSTKAMAFGNILIGGLIGVGVDVATGAAYDYPDLISFEMMLIMQQPPMLLQSSVQVSPASPTVQPLVVQPRKTPDAEPTLLGGDKKASIADLVVCASLSTPDIRQKCAAMLK